jgi:hypothetical protein
MARGQNFVTSLDVPHCTYLGQLDLFIEPKCMEIIDKSYLVGAFLANKMPDSPTHGGNNIV